MSTTVHVENISRQTSEKEVNRDSERPLSSPDWANTFCLGPRLLQLLRQDQLHLSHTDLRCPRCLTVGDSDV